MADETCVLIAGAGPTGMAAALFLARMGVPVRIFDKRKEPNTHTNAMGVNPRTLALLEETGLTARILEKAFVLRQLVAHQNGREIGRMALRPRMVGARHPMVIWPQYAVEGLLRDALAALGVEIERGLELTALSQDGTGVSVTLRRGDGVETSVRGRLMLAADGAHSIARHLLALPFPGSAFPETWRIVDAELTRPGAPDGYVDFRPEGVFLALPYSPTHWRLIGYGSDLVDRLPEGWRLAKVEWSSDFHISHRLAGRLQVGRVSLAGDAAHVHAPVGARGMNLGIEDAFVFAHAAADALKGDVARLESYGRLRHRTDGAVVRRVERLTRLVRARGRVARALRPLLLPAVTRLPPLMHAVTRTATGLDHEVELA